MKVDWNKKYNTIAVYSVLTFLVCLLLYLVMKNVTVIGGIISKALDVTSPIIWGIVIAYLINPIMMWTEKALAKLTSRKKPHAKLNRVLATIISVVIFLAAITAFFMIIIPQLIESITSIFNNFDTYMRNFESWINQLLENNPEMFSMIDEKFDQIRDSLTSFIDTLIPKLGNVLVKVGGGAVSVVNVLKDFFVGLFAAIYFLFDKEHFQAQCKKLCCAILPKSTHEDFFGICNHTNLSLSGFISGKIIDSIIIGILCFICMIIMRLDYAVLISVIIGVTNIIPIFGPIFGAVPCGLLLLISSPKQVIPFVLLIIVIQQLDGNVIGPKILGSSTGLSSFWVLFSIIVGGNLFGVAGMLLGVPIFAVIYSIVEDLINHLLKKKGMSTVTADYAITPRSSRTKDKSKGLKLHSRKDKGSEGPSDSVPVPTEADALTDSSASDTDDTE